MYELELYCPGYKRNLEYLDKSISNFLKMANIKEEKGFFFAIHELMINSIKLIENSEEDANHHIRIKIEIDDVSQKAIVTDWMGGISKSKEEQISTINNGLLSEGGRGIIMIEHFVDSYDWKCIDNKEFRVQIENNKDK